MNLKITFINYLENEEMILLKFSSDSQKPLVYEMKLELQQLPIHDILEFNDNSLENIHHKITTWKIIHLGCYNYYTILNFGIWIEKLIEINNSLQKN